MPIQSTKPIVKDGVEFPYFLVNLAVSPLVQETNIGASCAMKLTPYRVKEDGTEKKILKDINWFARLVFLPFEIYYRAPVSHHKCDLYINRLLKLANWDIKSLDYFIS